jgi:cell wall-associated NlpC family hydrolase
LLNLDSKTKLFFVFLMLAALATGCGGTTIVDSPQPLERKTVLLPMGYTIQVGAFSQLKNAIQLTDTLQNRGLSAYYFVNQNGLYTVRFGNLASKETAQKEAETLRMAGTIPDYFIVGPDDYSPPKSRERGDMFLRHEIVERAESFIGVPYRWGGTSPREGFDCSGFTMAVYRLNGLNLPRSSSAQWRIGSHVDRHQLSKADLVFFATSGGNRISHVGIYVGGDNFIHAPGRSKRIRVSSLSNPYFKPRYVGARSYL